MRTTVQSGREEVGEVLHVGAPEIEEKMAKGKGQRPEQEE